MVTGAIKVRRANRIIRVTPNELDKYLANGYSIVEEPTLASQPSEKVVEEPKIETPAKKTKRRK